MFICKIDSNTFPIVSQFIQPHEEKCIFLSSQIRRESENLYLLTKNAPSTSVFKTQNFDNLLGILYIDNTIFHCIPHIDKIDKADFSKALTQLIKENQLKIKCISGEAQTTELIKEALQNELGEPYQINHYKLMTAAEIINPPEELSNNDQIIRCTQDDMDLLFPIQKKYMNEEVAPFGKRASGAEVSIGLRQILKNQLVLALESDGEIVAKANTNAIGINWVQLGGIYTHPLYRRNGYAWQLVSAICRRTYKAGKKSALFVKDINVPAMELYKKLGFTDSGLYEICYF